MRRGPDFLPRFIQSRSQLEVLPRALAPLHEDHVTDRDLLAPRELQERQSPDTQPDGRPREAKCPTSVKMTNDGNQPILRVDPSPTYHGWWGSTALAPAWGGT